MKRSTTAKTLLSIVLIVLCCLAIGIPVSASAYLQENLAICKEAAVTKGKDPRICDLALDMSFGNQACAGVAPFENLPKCYIANVAGTFYYCSALNNQLYTAASLSTLYPVNFDFTNEQDVCLTLFRDFGYDLNVSNYPDVGTLDLSYFVPLTQQENCPNNLEELSVTAIAVDNNTIQLKLKGCFVTESFVTKFAYTISGGDLAASVTGQTQDVFITEGKIDSDINVVNSAAKIGLGRDIQVIYTDENSTLERTVRIRDSGNTNPEPTSTTAGPSSNQFGACRCANVECRDDKEELTLDSSKATIIRPIPNASEQQRADALLCISCTNAGNTWTDSLGCVTTTPNGVFTTILRIGIGVIGGVSLLRLIILGYQMNFGAKEADIKQSQQDILGILSGILLAVFGILLLRIIGVNILDVVPPGFFGS